MILTIEERKEFFKIWLKLLSFVNDKFDIIKNFGNPKSPIGLNPNDIVKIKEKLWDNIDIIDEYLKHSKLKDKDSHLVCSWKNYIKSNFLIIKELKKYCIFMDMKKNNLYGVTGISCPLSEMIPFPYMADTVLIPFNGKIVYDSLLIGKNISFGSNIKKSFNEQYSKIKREKGIIVELY